jgi:WhiB family redox-sensing transcriptional regulator
MAQRSEELWQAKAACRGPHSGMFFPPSHFERKDEKDEREARAKAICATCPVIKECREQSLKVREPYGVWGGLSEDERAAILAKPASAREAV